MKNNILNTVRNFKFAVVAFTALSLLGWSSDAKAQTNYWNTNGLTATWTNANWATTPTGSFGTGWTAGNGAVFNGSVPALISFASTAVGNITVNTDTTITAGGTLTNKVGGNIIDVAAGKTLTWTGQSWSTAAAAIITKSGSGTWNIGAQGNALAAGSSFTLGAGTVIVSGNNSFGGASSALNINGGTIQSSSTRAYANSAVTIGGDFENSGTGNATWSGTVALGGATRTINNKTDSGSRSYTGVISGGTGAGLTFSGAGAGQTFIGNTNNTFSGPITITGSEVIFNNNGAFGATTSITLDGGRLTMGIDSSGSALTNGTINVSRNIYVGSAAGTSLSVSKTNGLTTYNGVIANKDGSTGLLAKQGAGTLVLGGVSTYTGGTAINNGTLKLDAGTNRLPTGTVVSLGTANSDNLGALDLNGRSQEIAGLISMVGTNTNTVTKNTVTSGTSATLEINVADGTTNSYGAGTVQNSGVITGALALTKSGSGTQVLGDANTYSGGTTVNSGTLALSGSGTLGTNSASVTVNGGTLDLGAKSLSSGAFTMGSGTLANGTLTATSYALTNGGTVSGVLAGAVALNKSGEGNATLSGANTYTGATTISNGVLNIRNSTGLGTTANGTTVSGTGAALELQGGISVGAEALTLNGTGVSSGGAVRNISGNNTYGGLLTLGSASRINSDSGTLTLANAGTVSGAFALTVGGAGDTVLNSILGTSTGTLTKDGAGKLTLGGANTFTGLTTVSGGNLAYGVANALSSGAVTVNGSGAVLDIGTFSDTVGAVTLTSGSIAGTTGVLTGTSFAMDGTGSASAILGGSGATLTKTGAGTTTTLSGANTYTGATTVTSGTLAVNGSLLNSGSVLVNAGGFLGGSGSVGAITGAGTVGPGNSPGILTATSVDPTAGTDFKFEITSANPRYAIATDSYNDLLHLTAASPFAGGTFTSGNIVSIYLNSSAITASLLAGTNTTFGGGFFVDGTYGLAAAVTPAAFAYYTTDSSLGTGSAVDYNSTSYYLLDSTIAAKTILSDTAVTDAGFATGTASGTLLTFNMVPEPSAQSMLAFGMAALVAVRALRRGREDS
jgi:autotransporter-associated beta strand protein